MMSTTPSLALLLLFVKIVKVESYNCSRPTPRNCINNSRLFLNKNRQDYQLFLPSQNVQASRVFYGSVAVMLVFFVIITKLVSRYIHWELLIPNTSHGYYQYQTALTSGYNLRAGTIRVWIV